MRLISCYIENFGGLSRFSLELEPGLTVIRQPNGFGKTTLAEFIRAMFYGFPRKTPKTLGKREKYRPWNGGRYGGSLDFGHEGARWRIERFFGATPRGDVCKIYDLATGRETRRFSAEVGLELFGLDAESFERSTYLPQSRERAALTTDSIRAKLTDLVEDTDDVGNYEKAEAALRAKRSAYIPFRGRGGAVEAETEAISRLQQALDRAEESARDGAAAAAELAALKAERSRTADAVEEVRRALAAANDAAILKTHRLYYGKITDSLNDTNDRLARLEEKYPAGLPDEADLAAAADAVERAAALAARTPVTDEDRKARQILEEHRERFAGGVPGEEEFDRAYRLRDLRRTAEVQLEAAVLPEADAAELAELDAFFAPGLPVEEVLAAREADGAEAARLREENLRLAAQTVEMPRYKVPSPMTVPLLLGCCGAALLAGILLLAGGRSLPGAAALTLGLLALAGAGWIARRGSATRPVLALSPQTQALIRENEAKAAALEAAVAACTAEYGGESPARIRQRLARLAALTERDAALARRRRELTALLAEYDAGLRNFFERYRWPLRGDAGEALNRLRRACDAWEQAGLRLEEQARRQARHHQEAKQAEKTLEAFRQRYGILPATRAQVLAIRDDARQQAALTAAAADLEAQIARYRREHGTALAGPVPETEEPEVLRRREAALLERQGRIADRLPALEQRARQLRETAERIPELEDELARRQETLLANRKNAALLDDTLDFLSRAREELSTAYMGSIRENFAGLMERMAGEDPAGILVTPDLDVRLERGGASRELGYFSAGQTDLILLCMRLALVDALFRTAKPFVILDDPFVNLDDERTREALALLRELSRDRQIIYLVCNSSRA